MATTVKLLDGAEGYLRWKESVLLRLRTARVAHVLFQDPPSGDEVALAAKRLAHDDALCRGHILATLSNRLFPDYVRHATARELWHAVARTYDVDMTYDAAKRRFRDFQFDEGALLLEQMAHAEALAADIEPPLEDGLVAYEICGKHPKLLPVSMRDDISMSIVWQVARRLEQIRVSWDEDEREDFPEPLPALIKRHKRKSHGQPWACPLTGIPRGYDEYARTNVRLHGKAGAEEEERR